MNSRSFAHRPVAPRCRGGASSLLRLSSAAASRWPSATALSDWATRSGLADEAAPAPIVAPAPDASLLWFTRLMPSAV